MCQDCTGARENGGYWPLYRLGCQGCTARAVARSQAAIEAFEFNHWDSLDDILARLFRNNQREALSRVRAWWRIDHPQEQKA